MFSSKQVNGKTIQCMHSGIFTEIGDCSVKATWYKYVFVGTILSIQQIENDEFELEIRPDELFYGDPGKTLKVTTSQGLCFDKFTVNEQWLFYMRPQTDQINWRKDPDKPIVLDFYATDSKPVSEAQEAIETLRKVKQLTGNAIIKGTLFDPQSKTAKPLAQVKITATRFYSLDKFEATTDKHGNYLFFGLPAGKYKLNVQHPVVLKTPLPTLDVNPNGCIDMNGPSLDWNVFSKSK